MTQALIAIGYGVTLAGLIFLLLERHRRRSSAPSSLLEGRHVIVNTRRPDDQSIRGWVRREYRDGALELAQAAYLEPAQSGGVDAVTAGDVWVPGANVGFIQLDVPVPPGE